jgi:Hydrolase of X-linked nucleoside diphosphate N terminal/NUDIX domain
VNTTAADTVRRIAIKVAALAQDGLTYGADDFDLDRYRQLHGLAAELLAVLSDRPAEELAIELGRDSGYATPKIDVRGVVFDDRERVLLMREKTDGLWSLPGGWADPGDTPSVAVTREVLEETGYHSSAVCRRCRCTAGKCSSCAAPTGRMDGQPRHPASSRPWTSAGSTSAPCRRCHSAACIPARSSGPWPTSATPPSPPSSTSRALST